MSTPVYVKSDNIRVFPCANREQSRSRNARLTTEYNLVSIINKLVDKVSFVISCESEGTTVEDGHMMSININGYLFTFPIKEMLTLLNPAGGAQIYANINLQNYDLTDSKSFYLESQEIINVQYNPSVEISGENSYLLDTEDSEGDMRFVGLGFTIGGPWDPSLGKIITDPEKLKDFNKPTYLHILTVVANSGSGTFEVEIPQESKLKFETNKDGTHRSLKIDDGVL